MESGLGNKDRIYYPAAGVEPDGRIVYVPAWRIEPSMGTLFPAQTNSKEGVVYIMRSRKQYFTIFFLLFLVGAFIPAQRCQAASAEVTISADATQVTVGDKFFVYIYINSSAEFGNFETNVIYDQDILEYQSGASVITGGDGFLKVSDMNVLNGDTSRKYTLEFTALKVGYCDIDFSGRVIVYDPEQNEMSVSSTGLTINVKAPETASTNAKLKSLTISPSTLTPTFDPEVTDYTTTVSSDTDTLFISAIPQDIKSTVSMKGNDLLKEGENKVIVSVLAESGNIIEYTINVTKEAAAGQDSTGEAVVTPAVTQNSFELTMVDGVIYAVYSGRYTILEPDSSVEIPEGYKAGSLVLSGITVPAFIPIDNEESEFILLYAMNEQKEAGFYQYDRVEKTLQRYVPDSMIINQSGSADGNDSDKTKEYKTNLTKAAVAIAILAAFSALMGIIITRLLLKSKGQKRNDSQ
jgi:hypothetical protein